MVMRKCRTCEFIKEAFEYWPQAGRADGLQSECKGCMRERNNAWQRANKTKRTAQKIECVARSRKERPAYAWFKAARLRAKARGLDFDLQPDDVFIPERCPVLGIPIISQMGSGRPRKGQRLDSSPSLDRIDNSKGYVRGNVVIISYRANRIKSDASIEELRKIVEFYDGEIVSGIVEAGHSPREAEAWRKQDQVPAVFRPAKEESGQVSVGEAQ